MAGLAVLLLVGPAAAATPEQSRAGFVVFRRSVLERVQPESRPDDDVVTAIRLQATLGEYEPVQLAVLPLRDLRDFQVTASDLAGPAGAVLPRSQVDVRMIRYYNQPVAMGVKHRYAVVPKTLEPAAPLALPRDRVRPYWITVHVPDDQPAGEYRGTLTFAHPGGEIAVPLAVEVIAIHLADPDLIYGPICIGRIANLWKTLPSAEGTPESSDVLLGRAQKREQLLHEADLIFADLRAHGMTSISLRSASAYRESDGHPNLPEVEAAIAAYHRYGFSQPMVYCMGYLLKTNKLFRSSNYRDFNAEVHVPMARRTAEYYSARFRDESLPGILFMPVEEPNLKTGIGRWDDPQVRSKLAVQLNRALKETGARTAMTCTPQSVTPVAPYLDHWIAAYKKFTPALYGRAAKAHARLDLYANGTLMAQNPYFSRFFFGYFVWANDLGGMLPWTYPLTPKRFPKNVQNAGEGGLDVRDGFIGSDGRPIPTIEWEMAREGIDDVKLLLAVQRLAEAARTSGRVEATTAAADADRFIAEVRGWVVNDAWHYSFEDRNYQPRPQDGWDAERFEDIRSRGIEHLKRLLAAAKSS